MKKLTLSVAALLIAGMSYSQCTSNPVVDDLQAQNYKIDDVIDAIRMDIFYGHLERERGMYYVNELMAIKRDNEINIVLLTKEDDNQ